MSIYITSCSIEKNAVPLHRNRETNSNSEPKAMSIAKDTMKKQNKQNTTGKVPEENLVLTHLNTQEIMTVFVKKYQNNNENMTKSYRKWYGRTVMVDKVEIEELANEIQENCTVKRSDVLAVLSELGPSIKKVVQRSMKVTIPYLGTFKLGVKTVGADSAEEFDVAKNVKAVSVKFFPETKVENGHRVKELTRGARVSELPKHMAYLADMDDDDNQGGDGGAIEEQP